MGRIARMLTGSDVGAQIPVCGASTAFAPGRMAPASRSKKLLIYLGVPFLQNEPNLKPILGIAKVTE